MFVLELKFYTSVAKGLAKGLGGGGGRFAFPKPE